MAEVLILLAAYNGGRFIGEQIESLRAQTHADWHLLVRDDGSDDDTIAVVDRYRERDPRIERLQDGRGRLGASGNFSALLEAAATRGFAAVALCDQDDVWLPERLEAGLRVLRGAGAQPLLVHSDLRLVDATLRPIADSYMAYQGIRHRDGTPLRWLLAQNFVTGCTTLFNRALLDLALPLPREAVIHDWWLALCAASAGRIAFVDRPTVLYRQHDDNTVGARRLMRPRRNGETAAGWRSGIENLRRSFGQAAVLAERLERADASPLTIELARCYAMLPSQPAWRRLTTAWRAGFRRQGARGPLFLASLLLSSFLRDGV